eukprot:TRINITY_DN41232_c0_g1_i1.p1 TRINITY_DN41232_c0_g1~~TRINITY_DN41232_c0_g1_i1.p1  ORF type:complete len:151 (-),score=9.80 TRINITY_DN41232_c0_g1_i1:382-834(-)
MHAEVFAIQPNSLISCLRPCHDCLRPAWCRLPQSMWAWAYVDQAQVNLVSFPNFESVSKLPKHIESASLRIGSSRMSMPKMTGFPCACELLRHPHPMAERFQGDVSDNTHITEFEHFQLKMPHANIRKGAEDILLAKSNEHGERTHFVYA